jgi:eukaryotic-like serine/threonine-protein kinase
MTLAAGNKLGSYEIVVRIGAGGMGEVYRAHDTRLNRDVALKVLPSEFANDAERMGRFKREAQLLASLNHTNIAAIYGLEESGGVRALIMELAEGPTLAERILKNRIPLDEALSIARQIAEALEAAHEKGIIHRDLKPANIKITPEGVVKVLDFGLAKALEEEAAVADASESPTLSLAATKAGVILGTAAYMAPEQARGSGVDKRCDVWAFGVVLYEMLTGKQLFAAATVSDILAAVLRADVDWSMLPANTPASIRTLLRRCLNKDRKQRLQAIGDARIVIEEYISNPAAASVQEAIVLSGSRKLREKFGWNLAIVLALAVVALAILYFRQADGEALLTRLQVVTPSTSDPVSFAISPDGRSLVFVVSEGGQDRLRLRLLDQITPRTLAGTEGAKYPFWSPNSQSIGFFANRQLKWVNVAGGEPQIIADAPEARGGTWSKDDLIVFAPEYQAPLYSVPAKGGGKPVPITRVDSETHLGHIFPQFLPDGRKLLFYAWGKNAGIYFASLDSPEPKRLPVTSKLPASYAPPGYLLFMQEHTLYAQRFDAKRGELSGDPVLVEENSVESDAGLFLGGFSASFDTGILAYRTVAAARQQMVWVDRHGNEVGTLGQPEESDIGEPELSPDGTRLAVCRRIPGGNFGIWLIEMALGRRTHYAFATRFEGSSVWSPDSSRIVFSSTRRSDGGDLYIKTLSTRKDEPLLVEPPQVKWPLDWSKDGQYILYMQLEATTKLDLWALPLFVEPKPIPVANTTCDEGIGKFSPDVKWVAYESNESGPFEIYIQQFPGPGERKPVSKGGGIKPRWSRDGKELFYISDGKLMAVSFRSAGPKPEIGKPAELFSKRFAPGGSLSKQQYDVSPDGQRFLINKIVGEPAVSPITIVTNWTKAMKK